MSRPKVWVVTPELHKHGGTERAIAEEVERWLDIFDMRLYTMHTQDVDLRGVTVRHVPRPPGPHLPRYIWWFLANTLMRARDARRFGAPDVVLTPGINCFDADVILIHIVFARRWAEVKKETLRDLKRLGRFPRTLHRVLYLGLVRAIERRVYSGSAAMAAVAPAVAADVERRFGQPHGSVAVIVNGVDAGAFSPENRLALRASRRRELGLNDNQAVVLVVGNEFYAKGMDTAIASLELLPENVVLLLAGEIDASVVRDTAEEHGVQARVFQSPHRSDVISHYAAGDLFVLPSREDTYPLPPLEAAACGLPVVVSCKAGTADLFEDEQDGLILEHPDDPAEVASAIGRLLADATFAERIAQGGRSLAEGCTWDKNAELALKLVTRRIAETGAQAPRPSKSGEGLASP